MADSDDDDTAFASADEEAGEDDNVMNTSASALNNDDEIAEKEKLEKERLEKERLQKEKAEKLEKEKAEKERLEREKAEKEKLEKEKAEREKLERKKVEKEKLEKEKADKEKLEKEKAEREKLEMEKLEKEKLEKEKREKEKKARKEKTKREREQRKKAEDVNADKEEETLEDHNDKDANKGKVEEAENLGKDVTENVEKQEDAEKVKHDANPKQTAERTAREEQEDVEDESSEILNEELPKPNIEETPAYRQRQSSHSLDDEKSEQSSDQVRDPKSALERLTTVKEEGGGGWGWGSLGSWGSSVLNTATSSVNAFTNQVGSGINQVLHTVETGFVEVPDENAEKLEKSETVPSKSTEKGSKSEDIGVITRQVDKTSLIEAPSAVNQSEASIMSEAGKAEQEKSDDGDSWFASWGLSVSKKVVTGGLDVLETIGKKTFDILTEGDHGLKKVIERSRNKPNLSQMLREAKDEAEKQAVEEEAYADSRKTNFSAQFDDHCGLVQLEALEMLSSSSEGRLKKVLEILPEVDSESITSQLIDIKLTFNKAAKDDIDEDTTSQQDFSGFVMNYLGQMPLTVDTQKLLTSHGNAVSWLNEFGNGQKPDKPHTARDIHCACIGSLAAVTAAAVEHFHRASQLLLQDTMTSSASCHSVANCLADLTVGICSEISRVTSRFVECLMSVSEANSDPVTEIITNVYLESGNSSTYIRDAFQLLLPIIQLCIVKSHPSCKDIIDS